MLNLAFRRCMADLDITGARAIWAEAAPHLPRPQTDAQAIVVLHHARTQAESMSLKTRAYSHAWLIDHGYPSGLPDCLKAKAERLYPRIVDSVGISVNTSSELFRPIVPLVEKAMSEAVLECYADGHKEPEIIKPRMMEARRRTVGKLLGANR